MLRFTVDVLVFIIIALGLYPAKCEPLEKPLPLHVLKEDLRSLKPAISSELWPEDRVIKYDNNLEVVVRLLPSIAAGKKIIFVDGILTLAKLQRSYKSGVKWHSPLEIHGLYFQNGLFFYEDLAPVPELRSYDPIDYFLVNYEPPKGKTVLKPVIEYIPRHQFESELKDAIPKIIYESLLTGGQVIKTYFYSTNGLKIHAQYDQDNRIVVYKADFRVATRDDMGLLKTAWVDSLRFDLAQKSFPDLEILGEIVSVAVTSVSLSAKRGPDSLKITRKHLLKDVSESSPSREMSSLGVIGMVKYDRGRMFSLNYIKTNQREVVRIAGRFVNQDGDSFCCICLAMPEGQLDEKSPLLSRNAVLFSCSPGVTEEPQILLKEDTDYIETVAGYTIVLNDSKKITRIDSIKPVRVEPYLEYISYELLLGTLKMVSDAMRIRCANGYYLKSYRLFVDVFLVYDCNTGVASFDALNLWLKVNQQHSRVRDGMSDVTYDSKGGYFKFGLGLISDFKLRQLHTSFPAKVPPEMMYMYDTFYGGIDVVVDLKSVEWDLYNIRKSVFQSVIPQGFGVICVDDDVLLRADKLQDVVDGETRWMVVVEGVFDNCMQKECAGEHLIMYDGSKMISRNRQGLESEKLPSKVYLPQPSKLPLLQRLTNYQERYVSLNNFRIDMEELTVLLEKRCNDLRRTRDYDEKLTVYLYYFGGKEPMIGYYDCTLKYVFFFNDFKVIKYPDVLEESRSYRWGEELKFAQKVSAGSSNGGESLKLIDRPKTSFNVEEEELREKYLDYILRDLVYDQTGRAFHSRTLFLTEVYALRVLPSYVREKSQRSGGFGLKLKGGAKVVVYGQDAPKIAWM